MQKRSQLVSVYRFLDAREFLRQAYLHEKRANPAFSQRYIAQAIGARSSSVFRQLLEGKSRLTRARVNALARLFRLTAPEAVYFENLVAYSEAETEAEKSLAFERLKVEAGSRYALAEASQAEYFGKWHYAAVRELMALHDFQGDDEALAGLLDPPISVAEAREAVRLLLRLKLIVKKAGGGYRPTDRVLYSGARVSAEQVRPALADHLDLARRALDEIPAALRPFSYATLSVSEKSFREIREKFQAFRREVFDLLERDEEVDRLYQMNFQLFPVSKPVPRRKS